jgi:hypothetical protein
MGCANEEGVAQRRRDAKEEKEFLILIFENFAPLRLCARTSDR